VKASCTQKGSEIKIVLIADRGFDILMDPRRIFCIFLYRFRRIIRHANVSDRNEWIAFSSTFEILVTENGTSHNCGGVPVCLKFCVSLMAVV
jgi:hypothetical protein